jgi:acyl transferase domain-containing protein
VPLVSTVTGRVHEGRDFDAAYWGRNLRETVRFAEAMDRLVEDEGSGSSSRSGLTRPCPGRSPRHSAHVPGPGVVLPSLRRGEDGRGVLLGSLGALYSAGLPVAWQALYPRAGGSSSLLPWQRERTGWNRKSDDPADLVRSVELIPPAP